MVFTPHIVLATRKLAVLMQGREGMLKVRLKDSLELDRMEEMGGHNSSATQDGDEVWDGRLTHFGTENKGRNVGGR